MEKNGHTFFAKPRSFGNTSSAFSCLGHNNNSTIASVWPFSRSISMPLYSSNYRVRERKCYVLIKLKHGTISEKNFRRKFQGLKILQFSKVECRIFPIFACAPCNFEGKYEKIDLVGFEHKTSSSGGVCSTAVLQMLLIQLTL